MAGRVILSAKAYVDIDRIVEFNNNRNKSDTYSKKFIKSLYQQLQILEDHKTVGIKTVEENTYVLIWNQYYIFYHLTGHDVEISSIYHQKENVSR
ncbi:MAG: type II toxin-antitoxin system RelE/ParE family toxin [Mucilaginibacter sp.]|uniref:type II toxin-antitoxin system RelE/ParE family toxin n=1 Tax=Mucilaginibacter sp. TaxID=1882438 RepID=UPI0034E4A519